MAHNVEISKRTTEARRFIRRECGLLLKEVRRRADIGERAFHDIVNGNRPPRINEAHAVVMTLRQMTGRHVTVADLWPEYTGVEV